MPGKHSAKQKRQAKHVAASERKRGMDPKQAASIGWATVNARKGGPDVIEDFGAAPSPPKKLPTMNIAETDAKPVEHASAPAPTPYSVTRAGMDAAMGKSKSTKRANMKAKKSFRVMSIDEAYAVLKAEGVTPSKPSSTGIPGAPKKFPRGDKPTIKMKPISDQEAMANLKAGKHTEKAMRRAARKALQTGRASCRERVLRLV